MAECRYFPECQRCNETGDSWIPCAGGSDGTRCYGYEPMPDMDALLVLAEELSNMRPFEVLDRRGAAEISLRIREALGASDG